MWCDNNSVIAIINQGHFKGSRIMDLVGFLVLISMKHNFFVLGMPCCRREQRLCWRHFPISGAALSAANTTHSPTPLHHPAFANVPFRDEILSYADCALSSNIRCCYSSREKPFLSFCFAHRLFDPSRDVLASEGTLIHFASL